MQNFNKHKLMFTTIHRNIQWFRLLFFRYQLLLSELLCLQVLRSTVNIKLSCIPEINYDGDTLTPVSIEMAIYLLVILFL
jgi:hypothetical protein